MKTDSELQRDVLAQLEWSPTLDAAQIGAAVHNGVVTLTGFVPSYLEKIEAVRTVKKVAGTVAIADELEVRWPRPDVPTDTEIAQAAKNALSGNQVLASRVQAIVRDRRLTLEGEVDWHFQRLAADRAVESLSGVLGVINSIRVAQRNAAPAEVRGKIQSAFKRHAAIDAERISVRTEDGEVILTGSVPTWAEKDEAEHAAWATRGVVEVDNRISVNPSLR